ncbi:hypothetical protein GCM10009719_32510 [Nocardioides kribbensis]
MATHPPSERVQVGSWPSAFIRAHLSGNRPDPSAATAGRGSAPSSNDTDPSAAPSRQTLVMADTLGRSHALWAGLSRR